MSAAATALAGPLPAVLAKIDDEDSKKLPGPAAGNPNGTSTSNKRMREDDDDQDSYVVGSV